ncbi:hypothetical protein, partial [uncultured Gammaproteobacteria bacterium]
MNRDDWKNPIFAQLVISLNLVLAGLRLGLKNLQVGEKWVYDNYSYLCKGLNLFALMPYYWHIALVFLISPLSISFIGNDFTGINIKADVFAMIKRGFKHS